MFGYKRINLNKSQDELECDLANDIIMALSKYSENVRANALAIAAAHCKYGVLVPEDKWSAWGEQLQRIKQKAVEWTP